MSSNRSCAATKIACKRFVMRQQTLSFKEGGGSLYWRKRAVSQQIKTWNSRAGLSCFSGTLASGVDVGRTNLFELRRGRRLHLLEDGVKGVTEDLNPQYFGWSVSVPSFLESLAGSQGWDVSGTEPTLNLRLSPSIGLSTFYRQWFDVCIRFGFEAVTQDAVAALFKEYLVLVCHPIPWSRWMNRWKSNEWIIPLLPINRPDVQHVWPVLQRFFRTFYDMADEVRICRADSTFLWSKAAVVSTRACYEAFMGLVIELIEKGSV